VSDKVIKLPFIRTERNGPGSHPVTVKKEREKRGRNILIELGDDTKRRDKERHQIGEAAQPALGVID
jgi:hypothetical protein